MLEVYWFKQSFNFCLFERAYRPIKQQHSVSEVLPHLQVSPAVDDNDLTLEEEPTRVDESKLLDDLDR